MTAQQESAKATEEHLATRAHLKKAEAELEKQKTTSESDFKDMHASLTQVAEEASKKATDAENRVKELQANIKVLEAETAELKVLYSGISSV